MNICISSMSQKILPIHIQPEQNTPMAEEDDHSLDNFGSYKDEKQVLERQNVEKDNINSISKSSDTENCAENMLSMLKSHDKPLRSESLSFLGEIGFNDQKFAASTPISNIKYNYF